MKPMIEKLTLGENDSFVARTYRTPHFEVPWHQHVEYELILFTEGYGKCYIGNYIGDFNVGDIFFIGTNIPHTFQKSEKDLITSAVVVQFCENFLGSDFFKLPESKSIKDFFEISAQGVKVLGRKKHSLSVLIKSLEHAKGFSRIVKLCECLELILSDYPHTLLSTQDLEKINKQQLRIDTVFQFTLKNFRNAIALEDIAKIACMSVPAFCLYFKKSTKKTYVNFVNELRIGYACKLLIDTSKDITSICYESGFNTLTNFHKQFFKLKFENPSAYRKSFKKQLENPFVAQQTKRSLLEMNKVL